MSVPTNAQIARALRRHEQDLRIDISVDVAALIMDLRIAAERLEGEISEAKVKAAAEAMLKDDRLVFGMLTAEEREQSARVALEAAREA